MLNQFKGLLGQGKMNGVNENVSGCTIMLARPRNFNHSSLFRKGYDPKT